MNRSTISSRNAASLLAAVVALSVLSVSGSVALAGLRAAPQPAPAPATVVTADVSDTSDTTVDTTANTPVKADAATPAPKAPAIKEVVPTPPPAMENVRPAQERASRQTNGVQVIRGSLFAAGEAPSPGAEEQSRSAPVASYTSVIPMEPHKFQKHDILTIIVREDSTNTSTGATKSEKKQDFDLALEQYLKFSLANLSLGTTSPSTTPEIKFKYDNNRQNNANTQRVDSTALRISATVVDVKPNGSLVIEATKQITMDREVQDISLSGICRSDDITVDNTILSTQLADLKLKKTTTGEVRDGTRRGWLNSLIDKFGPF